MPQVWLVTGSSRGLGRDIVVAALDAGHQVVATARRPEQLHALVETYGDRVLPVALDVTDADAAVAAVTAGVERFGRIDVVVNNAGYGDLAAVEDMSLDMFKAQIDTNFYGVVNVSKAAIPTLRAQGAGHIIQISSVGGRVTGPGLSAYQSAKWAVGGFSGVLAKELAPLGIAVTVVEPGGMSTDWAGSSMTIPEISEPYQQTVGQLATYLREHVGEEASTPARVAAIILDLAGREDAPVHLLLGADAVVVAKAAADELAATDARWHDVSVSASASDPDAWNTLAGQIGG